MVNSNNHSQKDPQMNIDLTLLSILRSRAKLEQYYPILPKNLPDQTKAILRAYKSFFKENKDTTEVDKDSFTTYLQLVYEKKSDSAIEGMKDSITQVFNLDNENNLNLEENLTERLLEMCTAESIKEVLEKYNSQEGRTESDFYESTRKILDQHEINSNKKLIHPVEESVEEILGNNNDDSGLKFRLPFMIKAARTLQGNEFIVIAAPTNAGKSSLIASEVTYLASQLPPDQRIVWINNESSSKKLKVRCYQAALQCRVADLREKIQNKTLEEEYNKAVNQTSGHQKIEIYDAHDLMHTDVADIARKKDVKIIVVDMLDNVKMKKDSKSNSTRADELKELYQYFRDLGTQKEKIIIVTSQMSVDSRKADKLDDTMLADSKVHKQGAADLILMMTQNFKKPNSSERLFTITKNKMLREDENEEITNKSLEFDIMRCTFEYF